MPRTEAIRQRSIAPMGAVPIPEDARMLTPKKQAGKKPNQEGDQNGA